MTWGHASNATNPVATVLAGRDNAKTAHPKQFYGPARIISLMEWRDMTPREVSERLESLHQMMGVNEMIRAPLPHDPHKRLGVMLAWAKIDLGAAP